MNIGEAIRFVFEDEQWPGKLLLGAVLSFIPIFGGAALLGYTIAVLRNVEAGSQRPLPAWDRLGEYFVDGLLLWVALLVYAIPLLIFLCPIALAWLAPVAISENGDLSNVLAGIASLLSLGLGCLTLLYVLLLWVLTPVLRIRYAESGELASCLRFGEVFRFLFDQIGALIIAQIVIWGAGFVVTSVLGTVIGLFVLIPICGWIVATVLALVMVPAGVWVMLFGAHLYGQIGRQARMSPAAV